MKLKELPATVPESWKCRDLVLFNYTDNWALHEVILTLQQSYENYSMTSGSGCWGYGHGVGTHTHEFMHTKALCLPFTLPS